MDNLGSHRGKAVRSAIRKTGAKLLFLAKYSPDLNPIEQVFSKLKHLLKAQARSYAAVLAAIGTLLKSFAPEECANYLAQLRLRSRLNSTRFSLTPDFTLHRPTCPKQLRRRFSNQP